MENASDALLMAFAVLIFILALSLSLNSLGKAKTTADIVLFFSDRENFQTPISYDPKNYEDGGRTVGEDIVISTIARCAKEKFSVKIVEGTKIYKFEYDVQKEAEIKQEIERFIKEHEGTSYRETYSEVVTSGKVYIEANGEEELVYTGSIHDGGDGTQLEENVVKKIYITYTKLS